MKPQKTLDLALGLWIQPRRVLACVLTPAAYSFGLEPKVHKYTKYTGSLRELNVFWNLYLEGYFMSHQVLLSEKDVATILGLSSATIRDWRWQRTGPPFQAISPRCVRYDKVKLEEWIEAQTVNPLPKNQ